jgi:type IV pilus assembly protein PilY1
VTDISTVPLGSSSTALVKPNILFVLDDSGSMSWSHMPDALFDDPPSGDPLGWTGLTDKVGYRNYLCNTVYYNPNAKYLPPRKADGTSYPDATFEKALYDPYLAPTGTETDLGAKFKAFDDSTCWNTGGKKCSDYYTENAQAAYYYKWKGSGSPVDSKFTNLRTGECAKPMSGGTNPGANWEKVTVGSASGPGATDERTNFANWYSYYRTRVMMMKAAGSRAFVQLGSQFRVGLITINPGSTVSTSRYLPISDFDSTHKTSWFTKLFAQDASGGTPLREALARAGRHFAGYQNGINNGMSGDPVQYSCQQNFTILTTDGYWNGSGGKQLDGTSDIANYDGSLTDPSSPRPMWDGSTSSTVTDTTTNKEYSTASCTYSETYSCPTKSNPKRTCTRSVTGSRIVETKTTTVRTRQFSDTIVVSDSTGNPTSTSSNYTSCSGSPGAPPAPTSTTATNSSTGTIASSNSLSDVAQYYYTTDLRTSATKATGALGKDVTTNNVPAGGSGAEDDKVDWQHMTTFTMGLGLTGQLVYDKEYQSATTGDFADIRAGKKNWPKPVADSPTALDDLWHAAVDGRGKFFSAREPDSVVAGLAEALAGINARIASASAAATSNLEPVAGDNFAYTASYTTVQWTGELSARSIDLGSGVVSPTPIWSAQEKLDKKAAKACDNRSIYLFRDTASNKLVDFKWNTQTCDTMGAPTGSAVTTLDSTEQGYFGSTKIQLLSQYSAMTDGSSGTVNQRTAAAGANLVNYLRGQSGRESFITNDIDRLYRSREHILGDIVNAQPVFVKKPFANYADTGYAAFKTAQATRTPMVYVAANDGMLHAFYAGTSESDPLGGNEAWAFTPTMVLDKLWKLADNNYANLHDFNVDGTPSVSDVADASSNWKTILVGGLSGGGRGYYALDVTNPESPKGLWEFKQGACFNAGSGAAQYTDCNLGLSFGNPIISKVAWSGYTEGRWVVFVTSGYNNVNGNADDGKGFLYALDALTGQILFKIGTGQGSAAQPSGLGKISNWVNDTLANNYTDRVYAVDLRGNVWRFDVNGTYGAAGREAQLLATVKDASSGTPQPITTKPELAELGSPPAPFIYVATGRYLGGTDIGSTQKQTIYAIKDTLTSTTLPDLRDTLVGRTISTTTPTGGSSYRTLQCASNCSNNTDNGWYVDLPDSGERVNIDPKLQLGTLVVASNVPQNSECTIGGYSYINFLDFRTGLAVSTAANSSIGYKIADALAVGFNIVRLPDGKSVVITQTGDAKQRTMEDPIASPALGGRRTSWRELMR